MKQASFPKDHLAAEIAAVPLTSEVAFRRNLCFLDPELGSNTFQLWKAIEKSTLSGFANTSVDHLIALRDRIWFAPELFLDSKRELKYKKVTLHAYLRRLSEKTLRRAGAEIVPEALGERPTGTQRRRPDELLGRRLWRWLSFSLPPDLLVAGLPGDLSESNAVTMEQPSLARALREDGFAETHLHVGAGLEFSMLWIGAQLGLATGQTRSEDFKSPGASLVDGKELGSWILRAGLARFLLAKHLSKTSASPSFHASVGITLTDPFDLSIAKLALAELNEGRLIKTYDIVIRDFDFTDIAAVFRKLTSISRRSIPKNLERFLKADPIQRFFPCAGGQSPSSEMQFVSASLAYLERKEDLAFRSLFWQVVRIRGLLYRHLVQRPMTPGLQWFVRTYSRIEPARRALSRKVVLESAADRSGIRQGLRSLEIRTSAPPHRSDLRSFVEDYDRCFRRLAQSLEPVLGARAGDLEFGIVFHLARHRGGGMAEGYPKAHWRESEADPRIAEFRYAKFFRKKQREVSSLSWLIRTFPLSLEVVRGFDICTDELGVPNWVMAPLLHELRKQAETASQSLARWAKGTSAPQITTPRLTAHIGEDFVHLLGGLRRIDEGIEYFHLREGDRLGHGLSLGVNATAWAKDSGELVVLLEERLLDLTWEWRWYQQAEGSFRPRRLGFLDQEIRRISEIIFKEPCSPYEMQQLVEDLHKQEMLRHVGYPDSSGFDTLQDDRYPKDRVERLRKFLTDPGVFERGRRTEWVSPEAEIEVLEELQLELRKKVAARGLTVEINPTSNLLIGNLTELENHPLWRLHPPIPDGSEAPISVCIGSDDPITFATRLPEEYTLLYDSLVTGGLSSDQARQWLDRARANGFESRFTLRREVRGPAKETKWNAGAFGQRSAGHKQGLIDHLQNDDPLSIRRVVNTEFWDSETLL